MKGVNTGSSLDIDLSIIYSDEESEEDTQKEAEDSEESLEEAAVNISEAQTDNAETNSQPEIVKLNSSTMKEEIEFWLSYLGKIKKSFHPTARKVGICPILTRPYDIQWRPL